jgi:penicillin G amidase
MFTRIIATASLIAALHIGVGCSHPPNPGPQLTIEPGSSGAIAITGPTNFTAVLLNSNAEVTWSVTNGPGLISSNKGLHVVFTPAPGNTAATLTAASADGASAVVQVTSGPMVLTGATIPGLLAPVTVQYDAQDIPHIKCATKIDCLAVQGYLHARDRLFPMDFLRHVARSHLAEMIGVDGLSQDVQLRTLFTTRAGHRLEDDLVAAMDPAVTPLLTAYIGGINAYLGHLKTNPSELPGEYAQLPFPTTPADIEPWTLQDTLAMARLQQFQLSETLNEESSFGQFAAVYASGPLADLGKVNAWIRAAAPTTEQAHTLSPAAFQAAAAHAPTRVPGVDLLPWQHALAQTSEQISALRAALRPIDATVGSNNWVVAATKSTTHASMVANDPHLSLQYPPLFHLAVMTSALASDNLDLAGGAFPGIPGALVGRGAHVGWGVTVTGYDVTDLYLEQFLPQAACSNPAPCVLFNGAPTSTIPVPVTFRVRTSAGLVDAATLGLGSAVPPVVLIVPQHGPIIQAPDAAGKAISVRWTGHEGNTQDVRAILGLNTAVDVDSAIAALKDFATGAQNFVLADDQGHIAYDPHALVPVRQFADVTIHPANPIPPWFPVPGDGSAEWGDGVSNCASATLTPVPASCWIADSLLPQGKDPAKGYFFTANADPTSPSVSDDNNPLAHPPYLSFDWDDSTGFRATRIQQRLEESIAAGGVSLDDMESIQADHVSRPGKVFTDFIASMPASGSDPAELTAARAVFATWATNGWDCPSGLLGSDPKNSPIDPAPVVNANSAGCFLFHAFLRTLFTNVFTDDLKVAGQGVSQLQAMKAMIFMLGLDPSSPAYGPSTKFCNDVNASGVQIAAHTCPAQVVTALVTAYKTLVAQIGPSPNLWLWGRVHTIQPVSLLALVTTNYMPGPFARPGGAFTVDVGTPSTSVPGLTFNYTSGGNVRHISVMDPTTPVTKMQLPGPERDGPTTFANPDLLGQWVSNTYFDFAIGTQINAVAVSTQTFTAQ